MRRAVARCLEQHSRHAARATDPRAEKHGRRYHPSIMDPTNPTRATTPTFDAALRDRLHQAVAGLVYSSEADAPFELFFLADDRPEEPLTASRFAARLGLDGSTPVDERDLDDFLARHTERSDPWDARAQAIRPRYEQLAATLTVSLRDVRVFRVGRYEVRCYVVGRDARGNVAGLVTTAIET